jgi:hypothetical protein
MVNTEAYAQQSGAVLDAYLTASQPFRASLEKAMVSALQQLSMPTRPDFISVAERLTNVELRLDDMDNKLDRIERAVAKLTIPASAVAKLTIPASSETAAPKPVPAAKKNARKGAR